MATRIGKRKGAPKGKPKRAPAKITAAKRGGGTRRAAKGKAASVSNSP